MKSQSISQTKRSISMQEAKSGPPTKRRRPASQAQTNLSDHVKHIQPLELNQTTVFFLATTKRVIQVGLQVDTKDEGTLQASKALYDECKDEITDTIALVIALEEAEKFDKTLSPESTTFTSPFYTLHCARLNAKFAADLNFALDGVKLETMPYKFIFTFALSSP